MFDREISFLKWLPLASEYKGAPAEGRSFNVIRDRTIPEPEVIYSGFLMIHAPPRTCTTISTKVNSGEFRNFSWHFRRTYVVQTTILGLSVLTLRRYRGIILCVDGIIGGTRDGLGVDGKIVRFGWVAKFPRGE